MTTEKAGCLAIVGVPLLIAALVALGPIGGIIGIVLVIWVIVSSAAGGGGGGDDWTSRGRP